MIFQPPSTSACSVWFGFPFGGVVFFCVQLRHFGKYMATCPEHAAIGIASLIGLVSARLLGMTKSVIEVRWAVTRVCVGRRCMVHSNKQHNRLKYKRCIYVQIRLRNTVFPLTYCIPVDTYLQVVLSYLIAIYVLYRVYQCQKHHLQLSF